MNRHAGIIIGINHYQCFQPLSFAQQDAQQLHKFLVEEAGFSSDVCVEMTETSPHIADRPTYPTRSNLGWTIDRICRHQLQPGDVLWFFFSGYGVTWEGEDYLMPIDGKPNDIPETGIWMRSLLSTLKASAADRVFVLLDVNRATGCMNGQGIGQRTAELAKELEIPTVLSCQVDQFSRETAAVELGFFTSALLEALRTGCKTLDSLEQYLSRHLPQLSEQNFRPPQNPLWVVYPPAKLTQAVLPIASSESNPIVAAVPATTEESPATTDLSDIIESSDPIPSLEITESLDSTESSATSDSTESPETPKSPETADTIESEATAEPTKEKEIDRTTDPTPNVPTTSVTPPPKQKSKSLLDDESKIWIPMVVVGVILILAGGIGLAKLHQFIEQKELSASTSGNNTDEPVTEPVATESETSTSGNNTDEPVTEPVATESETSTSGNNPQESVQEPVATESETSTSGNNPQESVQEPVAENSDPVVTDSSNSTASPTDEAANLFAPANIIPSFTQVTLPENNRVVAIENAQASTFWAAIQTARQIRPSDPNYQQAQENIQNWSQVILDIAKVRAVNGNWSDAIAAVKLVPDDAPDVYARSQQLQDYMTAQLELRTSYEQLLDEADNSVVLGDASSYARAIEKIRTIKADQPLYREARARVEWWSMRIWQIASDRARRGQINLAIQTARLVPEDSQVYADAQQALEQWQ